MEYANNDVRRRDRLLSEERAVELLSTAEYGVLSLVDEGEMPYGIPVNFVWDGNKSLYIHCAPVGRKLRIIERNPNVSFCIVGRVNLLPMQFTTEYESVVLRGTAHIGLTDEEKMHALMLLVDKMSPEYRELGEKYSQKSFHRVNIIRIDVEEFSGKRKYVNPETARPPGD